MHLAVQAHVLPNTLISFQTMVLFKVYHHCRKIRHLYYSSFLTMKSKLTQHNKSLLNFQIFIIFYTFICLYFSVRCLSLIYSIVGVETVQTS